MSGGNAFVAVELCRSSQSTKGDWQFC